MLIPNRNKEFDCFDGLMATICQANNREYFAAFASKLCFRCIYRKQIAAEQCLSLYSVDYAKQMLEKVHGLKIANRIFLGEVQLFETISQEAKKNTPISIKVDIFDCPWSILYKKAHVEHEILAIDKFENTLLCLDPYLSDDEVIYKIPRGQTFFEGKKYSFLSESDCVKDCFPLINSILQDNLRTMDENFQGLGYIINDLQMEKINKNQLDNFYINTRLAALGNNRGCFTHLLIDLMKKRDIHFDSEIQILLEEKKTFDLIRMMIIKGILSGNLDSKKLQIHDYLLDVTAMEKELIIKLLQKMS